jgi:hypothetical protein
LKRSPKEEMERQYPKTKRCLTVLSAIRGEGGLIHGLAMNEEILVVGTLLVWRDNTPINGVSQS